MPAGADRPQDFDVFAGGASLHIATVSPTPGTGTLTLGGRQRRRPLCVRPGQRPRHSTAGRVVGREDDRLRRARDQQRPARHLHDERRRYAGARSSRTSPTTIRAATACSSTTSTRPSAPRGPTASSASSSRPRAATSTRAPSTTPARSARPRTRPSRTRTSTSSSPTRTTPARTTSASSPGS